MKLLTEQEFKEISLQNKFQTNKIHYLFYVKFCEAYKDLERISEEFEEQRKTNIQITEESFIMSLKISKKDIDKWIDSIINPNNSIDYFFELLKKKLK